MSATTVVPPLRQLPLPRWEPPYDDEVDTATTGSLRDHGDTGECGPALVQGTLALAFVLPSGLAASPTAPPDLRVVGGRAADAIDDEEFGPQPTARADLPDPRQWCTRFVQAVVEVLAGERPTSQLVRWTTKGIYDDICRRRARATTEPSRPVVRSLHISEPVDGVAEVAALVRRGVRCSALALRLEGLDGRWQCTALELP